MANMMHVLGWSVRNGLAVSNMDLRAVLFSDPRSGFDSIIVNFRLQKPRTPVHCIFDMTDYYNTNSTAAVQIELWCFVYSTKTGNTRGFFHTVALMPISENPARNCSLASKKRADLVMHPFSCDFWSIARTIEIVN